MTLTTILMVVAAAFIHASWNLMAKRAAGVGPAFVMAYSLVSCLAYGPWVVWLLVQGHIDWTGQAVGIVLLSGGIHLAYNLCLQRGYQVADLSVVYPIARGTGPMLSTIGAFLILRETPTISGIAGLLLVVSGILLIATQGSLAAFRRPEGHAGIRWGGATGGLIACYTVTDAFAVKALGITPVVLDWITNVLRLVLLLPLFLRNPRRSLAVMRGHWGLATAIGVMSPLGYILVLGAMSRGAPLSIVAPMREMSMMVGTLLGMLVLKEVVGRWRLVGCAVLIAGVILLSSS